MSGFLRSEHIRRSAGDVEDRADRPPAVFVRCASLEELPAPLGLVSLGGNDRLMLTPASIVRLRAQLRSAAHLVHFTGDALEALLDRAQAAAIRALGFGIGGEVQFRATTDGGRVQVWVRDTGDQEPDIAQSLQERLTHRGRVWLFRDESATVLVLEQER